jgi:hypothetical protein
MHVFEDVLLCFSAETDFGWKMSNSEVTDKSFHPFPCSESYEGCWSLIQQSSLLSDILWHAYVWWGHLSHMSALPVCSGRGRGNRLAGPWAHTVGVTCAPFCWQFVTCVWKYSISILEWKWDNALFRFSILCCTISTHFHRFTSLASVRFQNVFCSESHLNCGWVPNFKPSFLKIGVVVHSTLQYSGNGFCLKQLNCFNVTDGTGDPYGLLLAFGSPCHAMHCQSHLQIGWSLLHASDDCIDGWTVATVYINISSSYRCHRCKEMLKFSLKHNIWGLCY